MRGHAQLLEWSATDNVGGAYVLTDPEGIVPVGKGHTLPPGVPYTWLLDVPAVVVADLHGAEQVRVTLRYTDVEHRHEYETWASFTLSGPALGSGLREFAERDERPAKARRVRT